MEPTAASSDISIRRLDATLTIAANLFLLHFKAAELSATHA